MTDAIADVRQRVAELMAERKQGLITLTRTVEAPANPATPWLPGAAVSVVYELDAVASGVSAQFITEYSVLTSDLMVVCSPRARRLADSAVVDIVPQPPDVITIDGQAKAIKSVKPAPAAGAPALYRIFVAD